MRQRDVIVLGGGIAGAAAAASLAKKGVDVVVLEKEQGPHHKVCGEFISYEAQDYLRKLEIDIVGLGAKTIEMMRLSRGSFSVTSPLGFKAQSLSRCALDNAVMSRARSNGAEIRYGSLISNLEKTDNGWHVEGAFEPMGAKAVFLATGKHDFRGWSHRRGTDNDYIGFKMHYACETSLVSQAVAPVDIVLFDGGYAGLEVVERDTLNLCLVVSKSRFQDFEKNWDHLLVALQKSSSILKRYLKGARPLWPKPLSIFRIPYGFVYGGSRYDASGLFRLGDQMAVIPSLCGDGISIALHTANRASQLYLDGATSSDYHAELERKLAPQIGNATRLARVLSRPWLQPCIVPACHMLPSLIQRAIRLTRLAD